MNVTPLVSIITVSLNCEGVIEGTIKSILAQTYSAKEYIIVDGGSTDGTVDVIERYKDLLARWVTERDEGVYDAMNKGIGLASGEWLIFMNAGDVFCDEHVLGRAISQAADDIDLLYSDTWLHGARNRLFVCDHLRMRIIHQSLLYRKRLHEEVGAYLVAPGVTISDYLFFNLVAHKRWKKVDRPIAICDDSGISSHSRTLYQKLAVDLVFGSRGRLQVSMLLALYPFYKILKRFGLKVVRSGTGKNKIVGYHRIFFHLLPAQYVFSKEEVDGQKGDGPFRHNEAVQQARRINKAQPGLEYPRHTSRPGPEGRKVPGILPYPPEQIGLRKIAYEVAIAAEYVLHEEEIIAGFEG
jgi:glycosyltransferase involved in cell wall biosynthesis